MRILSNLKCHGQTQRLSTRRDPRNGRTGESSLLPIRIRNRVNLLSPRGYQVTRIDPAHCNPNIAKTDAPPRPTMTLVHRRWSARRLRTPKPAPNHPSIFTVIVFCLPLIGIIARLLHIIRHLLRVIRLPLIRAIRYFLRVGTAVSLVPGHTDAASPILAGFPFFLKSLAPSRHLLVHFDLTCNRTGIFFQS